MWTRVELTEKAKAALSQRYWKLILVGFIANITSASLYFEIPESKWTELSSVITEVAPGIIVIGILILLFSFLISIFVINPLEVGTKRFFLKSLTEDAEIKEVVSFSNGYMNIVKILFIRNLKIFLWTLLFIIPGIIKAYEYLMIPYLLAENPNLSQKEVFAISKQMMDKQKFETFFLEMSFVGWWVLTALSLGGVGIFYANPYERLTYAALYDTLSTAHGHPARASQQECANTYTEYEEI